jgi:hypothetical protein
MSSRLTAEADAGDVILVIIPSPQISNALIGAMSLSELQRIFRRALNTWEMPPPNLMQLCDNIDALIAKQTTGLN